MKPGRWLVAVAVAAMAAPLPSPAAGLARDPQPAADAQLKQLSLAQLGDVEVTTVSKEPEEVWQTPAAIFVLTQEDIRASSATTIPELLRLIPGVEVARSQSDQWAVAVRGFNSQFSKGLLVLIDGRSVYTPLFEGVYWDVQDLGFDNIERIEVIRGPGGSIWGPNAVNGVINIITKKARDTQGGRIHLLAGGPIERFVGEARLGMSPLPGLQFRVFAKGFNRGPELNPGGDPYDRWHQERGGFRLDWQPGQRDGLTATAAVYKGAGGDQNHVGQYTPPAQLTVDGTQRVSGGNLNLRWDHRLAGASNFYLQAYFDRTNRATSQFTETRSTFDVDFIFNAAGLPRQNLIVGAGLRESPSNLRQAAPTVDFTPHQINNYVYSLFAQDSFRLLPDKLTFMVGTKLENNNYSGWGVEPSARLLWTPRTHMSVWAAVSRALRTPGRLDRDLTLIGYAPGYTPPLFVEVKGNPAFQPEVLIGWEAGYRQLLSTRFYVDVATFHNQYDNVESFGAPAISVPSDPYTHLLLSVAYANGLRGVTNGVEIAPDWKPAPWLDLRGSYSYLHMALHSKAGFSQDSYAAGDTGSSPAHQVSAQAIVSLPHGVQIVPDVRYVSALPASSVPGYETADVHASYAVAEHLALSLDGRNLLQPHHAEFAGDDSNSTQIRRSLNGGMTWSW